MRGQSLDHLLFMCVFLLLAVVYVNFTGGEIIDKIETVTILVLQFVGFLFAYSAYMKSKSKWVLYMVLSLSLVFTGTIFDRFYLEGEGFENLSDVFWGVSYILFLYAFLKIDFGSKKLSIAEKAAALMLTVLFAAFAIYILTLASSSIVTSPKIIYSIYSFISVLIFGFALYKLFSVERLKYTMHILSIGVMVLAVYFILDSYTKIIGIFDQNRWVYLLYMLFYFMMILGLRQFIISEK